MRWLPVITLLVAGCNSVPVLDQLTRPSLDFELVIEGNHTFNEVTLTRALAFDLTEFTAQGHSRSAGDDVAFALEVHYRGRGYGRAEVDYTVGPGARLALRVEEGPRMTVDEEDLAVHGVTVFTRSELLAFFNGPRLGTFGRGALLFIEDRVRGVPQELVDEYVYRGHLDAEADPVEIRFSEDGTEARLTLTVREGPCYRVGRVRLAPGTPLVGEASWLAALFERFQVDSAQPRVYDPRLPFELRGALREHLASVGRPDSSIEVTTQLDEEAQGGPRVDMLVQLEPGPEVTIGALVFEGNEVTRRGFLVSRLRLRPGDDFNGKDVRESLHRLYRTGLFKSVDLELRPTGEESPDAATRDLVVTVEESPSREYFAEAGYGSYELFRLRFGAREKNLFGSGRQLRAEATAAIRALRAEVVLTDPWLFDTDLIGDVPFDFDERQNPSFTSRSIGAGAFVTKEWGGPLTATTFGYQYRRSQVFDVEVVDPQVLALLETVDLSSLSLSQEFNRLDNVLMPTRGNFAQARVEWGDKVIGSELDFLRTEISLRHYQPLIEDALFLATAVRAGVISPHSEDDSIPLQERYFNGGENTVRAFTEQNLGPKDSEGNPVGGEARTILNLELQRRFPESSFEVALFADAGTVAADAADWLDMDDLRVGYGIGVRYRLPIGPIRLDLGWNPDPREEEDDFVLHLALGIAF
jgi:outer membrane protein insertion porin family